jgi:CNT family concentrative nucleoside transporter
MERAISALGIVVFLGIAWLASTNRRAIRWRTIGWGLGLQLAVALFILKTPIGFAIFNFLGRVVRKFLDFSDAGASFVFGQNFTEHFFAFKVLPTIIFVASAMTLLYYFGVLQKVVEWIAWVMMRSMRTSGAESLSAAANIFVGQTEAPLFIRPYVPRLTQSELQAVMVGGFATIAAGVMAVYISFGVPALHLIAASVMAAPGALMMSKLLFPEEGEPETGGTVKAQVARPWVNPVDAAAAGAIDGMKLALNVGAMLIAFLALLALLNFVLARGGGLFGMPQLSLDWIFSRLFAPIAWLTGVAWSDCAQVGVLLGKKLALNEFIAYLDMKTLLDNGAAIAAGTQAAGGVPVLLPRSVVLATYALCGFANISSIAIQIGGIGGIAPERAGDLAKLGVRALLAGTLVNLINAAIAGLLL